MAENQVGRQQAVAQQALRSVKVGQDCVEQGRTLPHRGLNCGPFAMVQEHRHRVERPRPVGALRIAVNIVSDAVLMDQAATFLPSAGQARRPDSQHGVGEAAPVGADMASGAKKFVIERRIRPVAPDCGEVLFQWLRSLLWFHPNPHRFGLHRVRLLLHIAQGSCMPTYQPLSR